MQIDDKTNLVLRPLHQQQDQGIATVLILHTEVTDQQLVASNGEPEQHGKQPVVRDAAEERCHREGQKGEQEGRGEPGDPRLARRQGSRQGPWAAGLGARGGVA